MNIEHPNPQQLPGLRQLWKTAFGDGDAFLDAFYGTGFSPLRCRCVSEDGAVLAALYWFGTACGGQKFAYLYAVATDPAHRGRGLCRALMEDTKAYLTTQGFQGLLLVPENEQLARMYEKMGFSACTSVLEFHCSAGPHPAPIHRVDAAEYARLRRSLLPPDSVVQEGTDLAFLATQASFYAGPGILAAVSPDGEELHCRELLGDPELAPAILRALGYHYGSFRAPGSGKNFAYLFPIAENCLKPAYFGLALD